MADAVGDVLAPLRLADLDLLDVGPEEVFGGLLLFFLCGLFPFFPFLPLPSPLFLVPPFLPFISFPSFMPSFLPSFPIPIYFKYFLCSLFGTRAQQ